MESVYPEICSVNVTLEDIIGMYGALCLGWWLYISIV